MSRQHSKLKALEITTIITLSLIANITLVNIVKPAQASASYTGAAKPMEFYLHNVDTPVNVAGIQTKYIFNTTRWFKYQTQQDAYANSFYKPIGQPKIAVDFYLYPNFAGPVTIDGRWQTFIWVNGSAYKPTGFTVQFQEVTLGGATLWDSGTINPTVTSSVGAYIDVPVYNYNLSVTLTHVFNVDATLHVYIEVNSGSSADTRIWYDSPLYPSKVILPAKDYARPVSVGTYAVDNSKTDLFYYNWTASQRKVIVRVNVTDPLGGYDITKVNMTILDPTDLPVIDNINMIRTSNGQWLIHYTHTYEANWTYSSTAQLGNYTVKVSVIDNNGYYHGLETGSSEPFVENNDHIFSIGIIVYYNPSFHIVDDADASLPNAQVFITWPNGSMDRYPRYTAADGIISLTHVLPADYGFMILWKDVVVGQTTISVDSDGPYTIETEVYQLTVQVQGNNRAAVHGAYVIIYTPAGVGYGLDTTNEAGQAVFKLPKGTYNIEAHFSAEYWLKVVTTHAAEQDVLVNSATSKTIMLEEFPPPIWTTPAFWLIVALVGVTVFAAIYIVFLSRRHAPVARRRAK